LDIENEAMSFVRRTKDKNDLPVVVAFSGGKDSLATYLVVEKAIGESPPIFFTDTGIEFPETIEYIESFAQSRDLEVLGERAGNRFWESLDDFGPPARDFRWCCKILKLGPAATSIAEQFQGSVLSFMGQRKLESFQRSIEARVSQNPWVPGQVSANPIQKWNALEVWLYIFREKAPFNPLYNKGYHRMGCFLCPSSPLAELESIRESHPDLYYKWNEELAKWGKHYGFPEEWATHGFWRWKNLTPGQIKLAKKLELEIRSSREGPKEQLRLNVVKGVSPCTAAGFSLEGQFTSGIDLNRVSELLPIFGPLKVSEELGAIRIKAGDNKISLFSSGSLVIRGDEEDNIEHISKQVERAVRRAMFCQVCGSCVPQCSEGALTLEKGKISVDEKKCINCLNCDDWPCPTYLS
jgi:phosphoadenosine phosphosulfate reductase